MPPESPEPGPVAPVASAAPHGRARAVAGKLAWPVAYLLAVVVGGLSVLPGTSFTLVWPASAVALAWVLHLRPARRPVVLVVVGLAVSSSGLAVLTGTGWAVALLLGAGAGLEPLVVLVVLTRAGRRPALEVPGDLGRLTLACALGAGVPALLVAAPGALLAGDDVGTTTLAFLLRHGATLLMGAALALRLGSRTADRPGTDAGTWSRLVAGCALAGSYVGVFVLTTSLPVTFVLIPASVLLALRFGPTGVAVHLLPVSLVVFGGTLAHDGPFAALSPDLQGLLAHGFVLSVAIMSLAVSLEREERARLVLGLREVGEAVVREALQLEAVYRTTQDGLVVLEADGGARLVNPAAADMLGGLGPDPVSGAWDPGLHATTPDGEPLPSWAWPRGLVESAGGTTCLDLVVRPHGEARTLSLTARAMTGPAGERTGAVVSLRDVTERRREAAQVRRTRDLFATVLDSTEHAVVGVDLVGRVVLWNRGSQAMLGWTEADMLGADTGRVFDPRELAERAHELGVVPGPDVLLVVPRTVGHETRRWTWVHRDGRRLDARLTVSAMRDEDGQVTGFLGVGADVSAESAAERALQHAALHDPLTGLPNRVLLEDRLAHCLTVARRDGTCTGVLFLDLDGFKAVNDTAGHAVGDEVLRAVSARLTATLRDGDTLARMSGDEFVVLAPQLAGDEDLRTVLARVRAAVRDEPFVTSSGVFRVGVSVGACLARPQEAADAAELLRAADAGMYEVKRSRKAVAR